MDGAKSPQYMRNAARALAERIPGAEHRSLPGQTHLFKAAVLAPQLVQFFTTSPARPHPPATSAGSTNC